MDYQRIKIEIIKIIVWRIIAAHSTPKKLVSCISIGIALLLPLSPEARSLSSQPTLKPSKSFYMYHFLEQESHPSLSDVIDVRLVDFCVL